MRNMLKVRAILSFSIFFSMTSYAQGDSGEYVLIEGSHVVTIPIDKPSSYNYNSTSFDYESLAGIKTIQLMTIVPTQKMIEKNQNALASSSGEKNYSNGIVPFNQSPGAVDLGMSNVPVLDQGQYGTCVTFASTGALDARLSVGNYIDQQCSLALNLYLGNNYWNGANNATQILAPLKQYGIIPKGNCFGYNYANTNQKVSPSTYQTRSNKSYANSINYIHENTNLNAVKAALNAGQRVAIGTGLADTGDYISVEGFNMKINGRTTSGGLWACQQPSSNQNYCATQRAGHEIVIIGYDDNQQLLKIRNSWNTGVGDSGNFYMTYTFFGAMVWDQTIVQ
jgi:Papain family cysteine protease